MSSALLNLAGFSSRMIVKQLQYFICAHTKGINFTITFEDARLINAYILFFSKFVSTTIQQLTTRLVNRLFYIFDVFSTACAEMNISEHRNHKILLHCLTSAVFRCSLCFIYLYINIQEAITIKLIFFILVPYTFSNVY